MIQRYLLPFLIIILLPSFVLSGCTESSTDPGEPDAGPPRSFHLGFTPFPYDISGEAVDYVYERLALDGDLVAHHFDSGIPWPEALSRTDYHKNLMDDWQYRKARTTPGSKVYVAITPISLARTGLAPYRGSEQDMPLPEPWATHPFDHPDVKQAFLNHARRVVEFFQPDYLAVGIEVNLLLTESPEKWEAYAALHRYVYTELKKEYPDLPVFISFFGVSLLDGWRSEDDHAAQLAAFNDLISYSDYYGVSLYPFFSKYLTDSVPATMYDDLFSLSSKPIAVAETGYPADTLELPGVGITLYGTPEKQADYIGNLLDELDTRNGVFAVNFILRDYDALWQIQGRPESGAVWRDTGLYDEAGNPRPALEAWRRALSRRYDR